MDGRRRGEPNDPRQLEPPVGAIAPPPSPGSRLPLVGPLTLSAVLSGCAVLAGTWVVFAPHLLQYASEKPVATWNQTLTGFIIAGTSLIRYFRPRHLPALSGIAAAAGLWLLASPVLLGHLDRPVSAPALYTDVGAGLLVALVSSGSAMRTLRDGRRRRGVATTARH
ncbi:SPW repeat protein [Micromonospora sp. STR1s_5]|nr:SPW repeat protein [Micromonospora sp. STR1s_5]